VEEASEPWHISKSKLSNSPEHIAAFRKHKPRADDRDAIQIMCDSLFGDDSDGNATLRDAARRMRAEMYEALRTEFDPQDD